MNIIVKKTHLYNHTYKYKEVRREVGLCIKTIASKNAFVVLKYYATSRYQNLLLFKFKSSFHTVGIPLLPFMNKKPRHKGN